MKTIKLYNRDNQNIWLEQIDSTSYILKSDSEYALKYITVGYDNNKINYIDPAGGPFISIGDKLNNKIVSNIDDKNGIIIYLKDNSNDEIVS